MTPLDRFLHAVDEALTYRTQGKLDELVLARREIGREIRKFGIESVIEPDSEFHEPVEDDEVEVG